MIPAIAALQSYVQLRQAQRNPESTRSDTTLTPAPEPPKPRRIVNVSGALSTASESISSAARNVPPGSIVVLLVIIGFILLAIQPTQSGQTRLALMWSAIAGSLGLGTGIDGGTTVAPSTAARDPLADLRAKAAQASSALPYGALMAR